MEKFLGKYCFIIVVLSFFNVRDGDAVEISLLDNLEAPLKANLNISPLTKQLKNLIESEIERKMNSHVDGSLQRIEKAVATAETELGRKMQSFVDKGQEKINKTVNTAENTFQSKINDSLDLLQKRKTVIVWSCAGGHSSTNVNNGAVVKFTDNKIKVGMKNISTLETTGEFICESPGVYLVSVVIMSKASDRDFTIYKNYDEIGKGYLANQSEGWHTSTVVSSAVLNVNDKVYVKNTGSTFDMYKHWTCITITKLF